MNFPLSIAIRFIKNKKGSNFLSLISVITLGGISIGVTVLILAISILSGFESKISEKIINFNAHINISGFSRKNLQDHRLIEQKLKNQLSGIYSDFSSYISKKVIITKKEKAEGIFLNGIDSSYANLSFQNLTFVGGIDLSKNPNGIIIGKKLAENFSIDLNDKLTVLALMNDEPPSLTNLPIVEQFDVIGIYESGMAEYDDLNAYINFDVASNFFELDDEVTGYNINLYNTAKIDSVKKVLSDMLNYPFYVRSYRDINRHIFTWLELQQKPIPIVLGLIIIVAVFNIVGAVLMLVIQKTSAIGILRSLGANNKQILQIFLIQGLVLSTLGIVIGNILAISLSLIQNRFGIISLPEHIYYLSKVPISIDFSIYLLVSVLGFLLSFLVSIIPSYIASKIQPITAIKFD